VLTSQRTGRLRVKLLKVILKQSILPNLFPPNTHDYLTKSDQDKRLQLKGYLLLRQMLREEVRMYDEEWLRLLKELCDPVTGAASSVKTSIPGSGLANSEDKDLFLYYFLDRAINIGRVVASLVENGFYHDAGVAARTAVEGTFYLAAYKGDESLASEWRKYAALEDYQELYRDAYRNALISEHKSQKQRNIDEDAARANAEVAAKAAVGEWLNKQSPALIQIVQAEQPGLETRRLNWYGKARLADLITDLREDASNKPQQLPDELEELLGEIVGEDPLGDRFYLVYHRFSLVSHWNPSGLIDWELNDTYANAALVSTLECVHSTAELVNDQCNLQWNDDLRRIRERYNQKAILDQQLRTTL
jgi:hypothetical protein